MSKPTSVPRPAAAAVLRLRITENELGKAKLIAKIARLKDHVARRDAWLKKQRRQLSQLERRANP